MLVVVSGSRFNERNGGSEAACLRALERALALGGMRVTAVMHGACPGSPDVVAGRWADERLILNVPIEAEWDNLDVPGARIKTRRDGSKYNAAAGHARNERMARYAHWHGHEHGGAVVLALHDGYSGGTLDMVRRASAHGLDVLYCVVNYKTNTMTHAWVRGKPRGVSDGQEETP
jgi:hypothetical protein